MTKVLLTSSTSLDVKGGTERFSDHLKSVFPDLSIVNYNTTKIGKSTKLRFSPLKEPIKAFSVDKYILSMIEEQEPEVIFANGMYAWALDPVRVGVPIITILHGGYAPFADNAMKRSALDYYRTRYIYSYFEKLSAKNAKRRVSNSCFTQKNVEEYYGLESEVIHNAIDTEVFRPIPKQEARRAVNLPEEGEVALFVGRPDYSKGFDIVIEISKKHKDMTFVCVVNPPVSIEEKNIRIKSGIDSEELAKYYSASDFLLYPSRFDGFGYVPLEALSCNTPVISSRTGIVSEIELEGGFVISEHDPSLYSQAVDEVLKCNDIRTHKYVKKNFSLGTFSKRYEELVETLE